MEILLAIEVFATIALAILVIKEVNECLNENINLKN
jgi:hypothetical protein